MIKKTEKVFYYDDGSERRSSILCDENGNPIKPNDLTTKASKEWDKIWKWFENKGLSHLIDGIVLRDHCLSVCNGKRKESLEDLSLMKADVPVEDVPVEDVPVKDVPVKEKKQ